MRNWSHGVSACAAALLSGCPDYDVFDCTADAECVRGASAGRCLPRGCAYPNDDCASGWQYSQTAAAGLAGDCAPAQTAGSSGGAGHSTHGALTAAEQTGAATGSGTSTASAEGSTGPGPGADIVLRWPLDETDGVIAMDSAGVRDGVYHDVTLGQAGLLGDGGRAVAFDGQASFLEAQHATALELLSFSIVLYVEVTAVPAPQTNAGLVSKDAPGTAVAGGTSIEIRDDGDGPVFAGYVRSERGEPQWFSTLAAAQVQAGQRYRIAVTVDPPMATLYVDDRVAGTADQVAGWASNATGVAVGAYTNPDPVAFASVVVDDLTIYDRPLTAVEVAQLPAVQAGQDAGG